MFHSGITYTFNVHRVSVFKGLQWGLLLTISPSIVCYRKIVIGFAFMVPDVKYNEAYISFIFTHPEWRKANIATFMLYHLVQVSFLSSDCGVSFTNAFNTEYLQWGLLIRPPSGQAKSGLTSESGLNYKTKDTQLNCAVFDWK